MNRKHLIGALAVAAVGVLGGGLLLAGRTPPGAPAFDPGKQGAAYARPDRAAVESDTPGMVVLAPPAGVRVAPAARDAAAETGPDMAEADGRDPADVDALVQDMEPPEPAYPASRDASGTVDEPPAP